MSAAAQDIVSTPRSTYRLLAYMFEAVSTAILVIRLKPLSLFDADEFKDKSILVSVATSDGYEETYSARLSGCGRSGLAAMVEVSPKLAKRVSRIAVEIEGFGNYRPTLILPSLVSVKVVRSDGKSCGSGRVVVRPWPHCAITVEHAISGGLSYFSLPATWYYSLRFDCGNYGVTWYSVPIEAGETVFRVLVGPYDIDTLHFAVHGDEAKAIVKPVEWQSRRPFLDADFELEIAGLTIKPFQRERIAVGGTYYTLLSFRIPENIAPGIYYGRLRICGEGMCSETLVSNITIAF